MHFCDGFFYCQASYVRWVLPTIRQLSYILCEAGERKYVVVLLQQRSVLCSDDNRGLMFDVVNHTRNSSTIHINRICLGLSNAILVLMHDVINHTKNSSTIHVNMISCGIPNPNYDLMMLLISQRVDQPFMLIGSILGYF